MVQNKTVHQIQLLRFEALKKELDIVGFIRFMQQFDSGSGDYVNDRQKWQQHYDVRLLTQKFSVSSIFLKPLLVAYCVGLCKESSIQPNLICAMHLKELERIYKCRSG